MKSLVIGLGEVGSALAAELRGHSNEVFGHDLDGLAFTGKVDIVHVCFPWNKGFINQVRDYRHAYKPAHVIVHSTVPVGTCRLLEAIHSPVLGQHWNMHESFHAFPKWLGGTEFGAHQVADYFRHCGFKVQLTDRPETTELLKLLCTTYYGMCIEFHKDAQRACDKYRVPMEAWHLWNGYYNHGYEALGSPEYMRPELQAIMTGIGGHCVSPNLELLETHFTRFLRGLEIFEKDTQNMGG
jgi:hypothetical protein